MTSSKQSALWQLPAKSNGGFKHQRPKSKTKLTKQISKSLKGDVEGCIFAFHYQMIYETFEDIQAVTAVVVWAPDQADGAWI